MSDTHCPTHGIRWYDMSASPAEPVLTCVRCVTEEGDKLRAEVRGLEEALYDVREEHHTEFENLELKVSELREVLKSLEWKRYDPLSDVERCPECDLEKHTGHRPDCRVCAVLGSRTLSTDSPTPERRPAEGK